MNYLSVDCPECEYINDDQYQCTTCDCGGGHGKISIKEYIKENPNTLK